MLPQADKDNSEIRKRRQPASRTESNCKDFSMAFINAIYVNHAMQPPDMQEVAPAKNSAADETIAAATKKMRSTFDICQICGKF